MARAVLIVALAFASGCAHYVGDARPIDEARVDDGWIRAAPTPTVHQRNLADCGAAALAMIAGRWQLALTLDDAARALPPPGRTGVRLNDLRAAATQQGLEAYAIVADQAVLRHELEAGRPVIVGLLRPLGGGKASSHFEVVIALERPSPDGPGPEVVTIDPGSGWQVRSWASFESEWKPAGRPALVVLGPAGPTAMR